MLVALVITNCILNVFFGLTCALISYSVIKKKKEKKVAKPNYIRR